MNKLVLLLDDLLAVSKMPCYCDGHAQKLTVQKMSNEVVDVEIPMFSCCEDKDMRRVSKTMNLEGHCPAVEIRTEVEKMETHWPRKGIAATSD